MKFLLEVDTADADTAALARTLSAVAAKLQHGNHGEVAFGNVYDPDGSKVGTWNYDARMGQSGDAQG